MWTTLTILLCLLLPGLFAASACYLSLSALRRHITLRQLAFTALVLVANVTSMSLLFQGIYTGQPVAAIPFALISFTWVFSIGQFATAAMLGAVGRLRQKMA